MIDPSMPAPAVRQRWTRVSWTLYALCGALAVWLVTPDPAVRAQQAAKRANRMIETLDAGKPAITGDSWVFVDREHRPYDITELRGTLNKLLANKNATGQPALAPIVRVPTEGDQDVRWIIKQVLESGAMGIIIPQVEDAEQALKIIQSMRYPQLKSSKYPNPPGRRGCGCSGGSGWGLQNPADYVSLADVYPLNPQGELMALPMIETPKGVKNINQILDTPGVPGVLIGPSDLTMNYGEGRWNAAEDKKPDTEAAIQTVAKACAAKKKICAMVTANDAQTKKYLSDGFRVIYATYLKGSSS
jgi:4-hydroxy-2-oxoheptanedioate aldolase